MTQRIAGTGAWFGLGLWLIAPSARPESSLPCAEGVDLRVSTRDPTQGGVVLAEVASARPITEVRARWEDHELVFWEASAHSHRGLIGVDLESPTTSHPFAIEARLNTGERIGCSAQISVRDGRFLIERLSVAHKFVNLSAKDLARAREESEHLREIFSSFTPERLWKEAFRWPVQGIEPSGNFGKRRVLNGEARSPHSGVDLPAPKGTLVRAPARGRVRLAGNLFFSGNTVVLDHGLGLFTFYGHLDSVAVEPGQLVEPGDPLGTVGATGRVTGPHLHWAARLNEARVNPRELVELASW